MSRYQLGCSGGYFNMNESSRPGSVNVASKLSEGEYHRSVADQGEIAFKRILQENLLGCLHPDCPDVQSNGFNIGQKLSTFEQNDQNNFSTTFSSSPGSNNSSQRSITSSQGSEKSVCSNENSNSDSKAVNNNCHFEQNKFDTSLQLNSQSCSHSPFNLTEIFSLPDQRVSSQMSAKSNVNMTTEESANFLPLYHSLDPFKAGGFSSCCHEDSKKCSFMQ